MSVRKQSTDDGERQQLFEGDYELVDGVAWFTCGLFSIRIHRTDEGVVVDMYPEGREDDGAVAACYAYDHELPTPVKVVDVSMRVTCLEDDADAVERTLSEWFEAHDVALVQGDDGGIDRSEPRPIEDWMKEVLDPGDA